MKEIILLKAGEIALKGLNRSTFEDRLVKNCKFRLRDIGSFRFTRAQSTMYAEPLSEDIDMDDAVETLQHVFGFSKLSRACVVEKDMDLSLIHILFSPELDVHRSPRYPAM